MAQDTADGTTLTKDADLPPQSGRLPFGQNLIPRARKIFSVIFIAGGVLFFPASAIILGFVIFLFVSGALSAYPLSSTIILTIEIADVALISACFIAIGILLLRERNRAAHILANVSVPLLAANMLCDLMLEGVRINLAFNGLIILALIAFFSYLDPALAEERQLHYKLRDMFIRDEAERGTLGFSQDGRGYIEINFFNIFWLFVVGCVVGDLIETAYHYVVVVPGEFQIRAGMLWGPFSPIYGFGAVFLTLILNRLYRANVVVVFVISALVGGAFEYLVSWFLQEAFGIVAWDYSGNFLDIGGRTDFMFMCMWGLLGTVWVKYLLGVVVRFVNRIPWQWRYSITTVCFALMLADGVTTLLSLDCWYMRLAGNSNQDFPFMDFFAQYFGNDFMENRFQSMGIDPSLSSRVS